STTAIHLSTDLWMAKSQHGYLGVMVTWLSSDFKFQEALLSCNQLAYLHNSKLISKELFQIICKWHFQTIVFTITTDNSTNIVKEINLLHDNYFNDAQHLHEAQCEFNRNEDIQFIDNSLDVLTDIKTR
ncbi:14990_t:CDS:2, partial [Cetraspora pellucida]